MGNNDVTSSRLGAVCWTAIPKFSTIPVFDVVPPKIPDTVMRTRWPAVKLPDVVRVPVVVSKKRGTVL